MFSELFAADAEIFGRVFLAQCLALCFRQVLPGELRGDGVEFLRSGDVGLVELPEQLRLFGAVDRVVADDAAHGVHRQAVAPGNQQRNPDPGRSGLDAVFQGGDGHAGGVDAGLKLVCVGRAFVAHKAVAVVVHPLGHGGVHIQGAEEGDFGEDFPQLLQQVPLRVPQPLDVHGAVESEGNGVDGGLGLGRSGGAEDFGLQRQIKVPVHLAVGHGGGEGCGDHLIALVLQGLDDAGQGAVWAQMLENLRAAEDMEVVPSGDDGAEGIGLMVHRSD